MIAMNEATIGMAVFLEDAESYNHAMKLFKARVPATIYMTSDGEYPVAARGESASPDAIVNYWFDQDIFSENGQAQETCRDLEHTGYSLASISHVAETARIQGEDLYKTDIGRRLRYGLEFQARFSNGEAVPSWLCGGKLDLTLGPVTEVGFNALSFRMGIDMPETRNWTLAKRPVRTNGLFVAFESLTHAQNPA
jgi:hypothetical protein